MIKIITDPKLIEELDKHDLYISPSEGEETYDDDLLKNDRLKKSIKIVGQENPISVALWDDDPYRNSKTSEKRVHMRIINGRHRYLQDKNSKRRYYHIGSWQEYLDCRINFGIRKKDNDAELRLLLTLRGEGLSEEGIPDEKISSRLCKLFPAISKQKILSLIPEGWRDSKKAANRRGKTEQKKRNTKDEECQKEIDTLNAEIQRLNKALERDSETISAMDKHIAELEIGSHK